MLKRISAWSDRTFNAINVILIRGYRAAGFSGHLTLEEYDLNIRRIERKRDSVDNARDLLFAESCRLNRALTMLRIERHDLLARMNRGEVRHGQV